MAEVAAPAKTVAKPKQETFTRKVHPRQYTFQLLKTFPHHDGRGGLSDAFAPRNTDYPERFGVTNQDDIYWPFIDGKPVGVEYELTEEDRAVVEYYPRTIRYIAGATSIFLDEQEATSDAYKLDINGRNRLLENAANKDRLVFTKGEINVDASDRNLWNYLWCMNQCQNQNPKANNRGTRAKAINAEFKLLDFAYMGVQKVALGAQKEKAFDLARTARVEEMVAHAKYLGISFTHVGTMDARDMDDIRAEYKDYAYTKPDVFLKTFSDPKVKVVYQISKLIENEEITLLKTPGQAHWVATGNFITVIPPDDNPIEYLAGYALTKDGEEFMNNVRSFK